MIVHRGLAGVSINTSLVLPGCSAPRNPSGSAMSMTSTCKPQCMAKFNSQLRNGQYMTFGTSTWSPGASA